MKKLEDLLEKCYCGKVLALPKEGQNNNDCLVYECEKCGYTYVIYFTALMEV
jgi:hypothetical protein